MPPASEELVYVRLSLYPLSYIHRLEVGSPSIVSSAARGHLLIDSLDLEDSCVIS